MSGGGRKSLALGNASLSALALGMVFAGALFPTMAVAQPDDASAPARRTIIFSVPLQFGQQVLGDVQIEAGGDANVRIDTVSLRSELSLLLNDVGKIALDQVLIDRPYVSPGDLAAIGIDLRFDEASLTLVVDAIRPDYRPVRSLGQATDGRAPLELPTLDPAHFSSYLNINANADYQSRDGLRQPDLFLNGATRLGRFVLEYDGAFTDQFGEGYRFYRRGVRAVYDQPEKNRRFSAGDLRVANLPILRTPFIGGVAVEKSRRIFDPFLPVARLGGREIFLDSASTVEVLINGSRYQTFQLDAGRYDLANLPVQLGANDVQLVVRDSAGRQQTIALNYFFEPLDLPAGEEEYALAVGVRANILAFEADYTDEPALSGFYRKALSDTFILGGGLQLSENLQVAAVTTTFVPQVIPGAFDIELAASTGDGGTGYAARGNYRFRSAGSFATAKQLAVNVDFESRNFQTIADIIPSNFDLLNVGVSYSQGLGERTYLSAGAIYTYASGPLPDRSTLFADVIHRLTDRLRITAGLEYGKSTFFADDFGVRLGISLALGGSTRATADYRSRTETFRANLSHGGDSHVGSMGYDLGFTETRGQTSADASVNYIGNRFDARASVFTDGPSLGSLTDQQAVRLQIGTSLAYADGAFGIGRPVGDSFAVVHPHPALGDSEVIVGRSLSENRYDARSGLLGGAVQGDLSSYTRQDVQYDVDEPRPGADIGDGTVRVDPPFRSGYNIQVGSEYFVSATGFLVSGGEPVALAVGTVTSPGDAGFTPITFFTNSVGRFAMLGLAPGKTYEVVLTESGRRFTFRVPDGGEALFQMGQVEIEAITE